LDKYKIQLSINAKEDLKSIIWYIKNELNESEIANNYYKAIKEEIETLEYLPQRYAIIDDDTIKDLKLRKLIIRRYIAFYRINENEKIVSIERIIYGASNWINNL
jgi:toxin ParE1/3/4